jgi:hypothetical protein
MGQRMPRAEYLSTLQWARHRLDPGRVARRCRRIAEEHRRSGPPHDDDGPGGGGVREPRRPVGPNPALSAEVDPPN